MHESLKAVRHAEVKPGQGNNPMPSIIVIGASAGGVRALTELVSGLPGDLNASLFIVMHFPAGGHSLLCEILNRSGPLHSACPVDGQEIRPGRIYVGEPDQHHMLIAQGFVRLVASEKEHSFRPAIDPLFRSAAAAYGPSVTGVLLSGMGRDGVAGLQRIRAAGGVTVVQDPREARNPELPDAAMTAVKVDYCLPVRAIAALLLFLVDRDHVATEATRGFAHAKIAEERERRAARGGWFGGGE